MTRTTPLHDEHVRLGAKMVEFAGWSMPISYGSQIEEHHAVRREAGMFDVSHMTVIDVEGADRRAFLRRVMASDPGTLVPGQAQYGLLLNTRAGIIDDLLVYRLGDDYRLVVNAATRDTVVAWLTRQAGAFAVGVVERPTLAMIAVQGPAAIDRFAASAGDAWASTARALKPFTAARLDGAVLARTGYTGEDGVELILPGAGAAGLWRSLERAGVAPCGLGARDTLRLEAGLNLSGQDMDETTHPLESNLGWTVAWSPEDRDFIGRAALGGIREQGSARRLTGVVTTGRGILRRGFRVDCGDAGEGVVTSGIFSPTLGYSIALARVPAEARGECAVDVRGRAQPARLVKPPFVKNGRQVFK